MPLYSSNTLDTDKSVVVRFTNSAKLDFYIISWNIGLERNARPTIKSNVPTMTVTYLDIHLIAFSYILVLFRNLQCD